MFGKKDNENKQYPKITSNSPATLCYIAPDCEIKGSFTSKGNVRIDGQIEGTIKVDGDLTVGQNAVIKADIEAQNVSIAGEVRGNIKTRDLLEIGSSAKLFGDIVVKQLKIEQGARFIGSSSYEGMPQGNDSSSLKSNKDNSNNEN